MLERAETDALKLFFCNSFAMGCACFGASFSVTFSSGSKDFSFLSLDRSFVA